MTIKSFSSYAVDSDTVLKRVADLFSKPKNWCQRAWAKAERGEEIDYGSTRRMAKSDKACGICTMAGVYRAQGTTNAETVAIRRLALAIVNKHGDKPWNSSGYWTVDRVLSSKKDELVGMIVDFNDFSKTTFQQVQKAVAAARGLA
jgi:hypothetical protein